MLVLKLMPLYQFFEVIKSDYGLLLIVQGFYELIMVFECLRELLFGLKLLSE